MLAATNIIKRCQATAETSAETSMGTGDGFLGNTSPLADNNIYHVGDSMEYTYFDDGTIHYTLNDVKIGTDIEAMELSLSQFDDSSMIQADGTLSQPGSSLVAVWVTVKNIDVDMQNNFWGIEAVAGNEENIFAQDGPYVLYSCYSSEWSGESQKDFYKLSMEQGEERQMVIAWLVSDDLLDSPFYYVIGGSNPPENWKYFVLSEGGEIIRPFSFSKVMAYVQIALDNLSIWIYYNDIKTISLYRDI